MSNELFWLVMTTAMTGLIWLPYILDRIMVRGLMGAMANPSPSDKAQSPWARRMMTAYQCSRKSGRVRAASFSDAGAGYRDSANGICLRALFLVAACACRGLYIRHPRAAHAVVRRRLRGAGAAGARDLQSDLNFAPNRDPFTNCGYGNNATCSSPVVSGRPSITFIFCTAWPDAPFVRLSSAETIMARPGMRSAATPMKVMFEPRT